MTIPPNARPPMFALDGVAKSYPGTQALLPLSLTIEAGERVAVLGPSGSGKTTLLYLMAGLVQPDQGAIYIDGIPLSSLDPGRRLSGLVGVIHQQLDLVPHLAVVHNVLAGRLGQWSIWRSMLSLLYPRDRHLAVEALEKVGIAHKMHEKTSRLSGGEQQRVAMARLLLQAPSAILADEPVASLDPARADALMHLLTDIVTELDKTLVASVHSVHVARTYLTRAIGLRNGELQFDLPVDRVTDELLERLYDIQGLKGEVESSLP